MNISFDQHHLDYINFKLKAGGYVNAAEVVREALRLMERQDEAGSSPELENALIKGLSKPSRPLDKDYFPKMKARLRAKHKRAA